MERERGWKKKGGEEKKVMVALLVFIMVTLDENKLLGAKGPFGGNVFKNPARYIYMKSSRPFAASHSSGTKPPCWREGGVLREEKK